MTLLIIALTPLLLAFWAQSKVGILAALIFALALLLTAVVVEASDGPGPRYGD